MAELTVFISYKSKDEAIASKFKALLEEIVVPAKRPRLHVFASSNIPKGADWDKQIHQALRQSD